MRTLIVITSLAVGLAPAMAQKADRLPDAGPRTVRTIPITPSLDQHRFDQRWPEPSLLVAPMNRGPLGARAPLPDGLTEADSAPVEAPAPLPRPKKLAEDRAGKPVCLKHGLRTVWQGRTWRCR